GNAPYEKDGQFLLYNWDVDNLDNKHIFIVGESGSGKTVFLKSLAYQLRKHNSSNRVILTDVQGDIVQLLVPDVARILEPTGWQERVERASSEAVTGKLQDFQLIVPARPGGNSQQVRGL